MPKGQHPSGEEKSTKTQGEGGGMPESANAQRANPDDASSIANTHKSERHDDAPHRGGRQGGGVGSENSANGAAVGGAFGRENKVSPGYVAGDPEPDPTSARVVGNADDL